ncbi:MAG: DNA cytosine methyltransferase [Sphaerochaeta sp.]|nr:DNA cytosine methyltransferase [Sphaerochaeta sp.]
MLKLNHLELFAGIGGFRRAFDLLGQDHGIGVPCAGFSEIDKSAKMTYKANYDLTDTLDLGDIELFTQDSKAIEDLPDFTVLTGGFPCQSFSMMGLQQGFDDERGNLFFNILKILSIKKPPFVLLENVRRLLTHDDKRTFTVICQSMRSLGYSVHYDVFNTQNFGLAQKRNRVFIFASRVPLPKSFEFNQKKVMLEFQGLVNSRNHSLQIQKDVLDILGRDVDRKYFLSEKIKPTILSDGTGNYFSKSTINCLVARPLTATMVKMHRANQDNYYSHDFLNSADPYSIAALDLPKTELLKKDIRRLTPKEALLLQGFSTDFYKKAFASGVSEFQLLKQAGNAVSVNTVYSILYYLFIREKLI